MNPPKGFVGSQADWESLSPGMRREIAKSAVTAKPEASASAAKKSVAASAPARGMTKAELSDHLAADRDGDLLARLIDDGRVTLHETADTLPGEAAHATGTVQGMAASDGRVHLVAANLTPDTARGALMHEVFHAGAEPLIGAPAMRGVLREVGADRRVLVIGDEAWPAPIPLVRAGDRWRFATELGADELANRRVGANERNAIHVLRTYVDAQRAYAAKDRDGDGVLQYAQKLASTPGKQDGLYWPADAAKGEEASPFGPLIAESAPYRAGHAPGDPYRGYHFKVLTRQGKSAAGGSYNYLINGRMLAGYAMVAYPAVWDQTGVMTFIVNQNGKVYQKDLGKNSTALGANMTTFDPGPGWKEVTP